MTREQQDQVAKEIYDSRIRMLLKSNSLLEEELNKSGTFFNADTAAKISIIRGGLYNELIDMVRAVSSFSDLNAYEHIPNPGLIEAKEAE